MELGKCFSYLKMNDVATEYYEKSLQLKPDSYTSHKSFAMHLKQIKDYDSAIEHFDFCIECKDNQSDIRYSSFLASYAQCQDHAQNNNDEIAEKYYKLAIANDNKRNAMYSARNLEYYAQFLTKLERYDDALE